MPDKKYWDIRKKKEVVLPSDYFECARCLGKEFAYSHNQNFDSGESTKKFKQTCLKCGEIFYSDKKYFEEYKDRFILADERKARIKDLENARKRAFANKQLEEERKEALNKANEEENQSEDK